MSVERDFRNAGNKLSARITSLSYETGRFRRLGDFVDIVTTTNVKTANEVCEKLDEILAEYFNYDKDHFSAMDEDEDEECHEPDYCPIR